MVSPEMEAMRYWIISAKLELNRVSADLEAIRSGLYRVPVHMNNSHPDCHECQVLKENVEGYRRELQATISSISSFLGEGK